MISPVGPSTGTGSSISESRRGHFPFPSLDMSSCCSSLLWVSYLSQADQMLYDTLTHCLGCVHRSSFLYLVGPSPHFLLFYSVPSASHFAPIVINQRLSAKHQTGSLANQIIPGEIADPNQVAFNL